MNLRIKNVLLFVLLINGKAFSQNDSAKIFTLRQCVETAITNNLQVKQGDLQAEAASINLSQSKANLLPNLFGNLNHGINQGRSIDPFTNNYINQSVVYGNYSLSTGVTLFNGYQLKNLVKQNALSYQAAKWDLQTIKDNLTLNVILAYLQILSNEALLEQSRNQAALTIKQVERLEILDKEGAIIPAQLYELKGQFSNDELAVINNENALQLARLNLSQLMNIPYDKNMEVEKLTADNYVAYTTDPETIYKTASTDLAQIKATDLRRQSAQKAVQVAKGNFYPQIGLGGNLNSNYSSAATTNIFVNSVQVPSGDFVNLNGSQLPVITTESNYNTQKISYFSQFYNNYNTSVYLNIRIPIFNASHAKYSVALAKNNLKNLQYSEDLAKIQIRQSIEQAHLSMTAAYKKYQTLLQQVQDFTIAFKSAEVRYNAGVTTQIDYQIDYLIAKNNLDNANINLITALYDYIFQTKILDFYQGKLVL